MINEPNYASRDRNIESLKEIARKLGKRTSFLNLYDPQVTRLPRDWKEILTSTPNPSDFFTRKVSYHIQNLQVMLSVNDEFLSVLLNGLFGDSVLCSFVVKSVVFPHSPPASKAICREYGCNVYLNAGHDIGSTITFLKDPLFQQYYKSLGLSGKESFHILNGQAVLYLQRFGGDEVLAILENLYKIIKLLPLIEKTQPNFDEMPEKLKVLIPLILKWAIFDDLERTEKISRTSSKVLLNLVSIVNPYFNAINQYLDSFENRALPEHAILLSRFAECVTESQLTIKARAVRKFTQV